MFDDLYHTNHQTSKTLTCMICGAGGHEHDPHKRIILDSASTKYLNLIKKSPKHFPRNTFFEIAEYHTSRIVTTRVPEMLESLFIFTKS